MTKFYMLVFCLHFFCNAFSQIKLIKTTLSPAGISKSNGSRYSLSHTIGQSSPINSFQSTSTRLLQGFQHPFLYDRPFEKSAAINFSVFPNPSVGKVFIFWDGDVVTEQVDVSLFDLQGKLIDKTLQTRNGNKIEADFTKSTKGIYELVVQGEKSGLYKVTLFIN